jgi:hypothetical protein
MIDYNAFISDDDVLTGATPPVICIQGGGASAQIALTVAFTLLKIHNAVDPTTRKFQAFQLDYNQDAATKAINLILTCKNTL